MGVELGTAATQDSSAFATAAQGLEADAAVKSVVAGSNVIVDNTDPQNPIVSASALTGYIGNPSVAPVLSSVSGGTLAAATYYVKITYENSTGETLPSPESNLAVALDNLLVVDSPSSATNATGYNVYVSTTTGTETKQNSTPISIGTNWTEPTSGLISGSALPSSNTTGTVGGTVSSVSVAAANGFLATVANPTTTPDITIKTGVTGILYGNGTGVSAAVPANFPTLTSLGAIATIAALRLYSGTAFGQTVFMQGYTTQNDGAQGPFQWGAYATDNGGTIITPTGQVAGSWYRIIETNEINILSFGASLSGANSTAAIDNTSSYCRANGYTLLIPATPVPFVYNGTGIYGHPIRGEGRFVSSVNLGTNISLVVSPPGPVSTPYLDIKNIGSINGFGLVRLTYTGSNSNTNDFRVEDFFIQNASGPAFSSLASDHPFIKLKGMVNYPGGGPAASMAVALAGLTDSCDIDIDSLGPAIGVKLGSCGNNARIKGSFTRNSAYTTYPRIGIWLVAASAPGGSGGGLVISEYKFGNENKDPLHDYHVVIADENLSSGSDFSTRIPSLATASVGYSSGWNIRNCYFSDAGASPAGPLIFSTTPSVFGASIGDIFIDNSKPSYIIQYLTPGSPNSNSSYTKNIIGTINTFDEVIPSNSIIPSNDMGTVIINDRSGIFERFVSQPLVYSGGGTPVGYNGLVTSSAGITPNGTTVITSVADALGGTDAINIDFASNSLGNSADAFFLATSVIIGVPVFIEFDAAPGATSSLTDFLSFVRYGSGTQAVFTYMDIPVPAVWTPYRFMFVPNAATNNFQWVLQANNEVSGGNLKIGRVHIYQAREPVQRPLWRLATTGTTAPAAGGAGALPATPKGYVTVYINGIAQQIAYY